MPDRDQVCALHPGPTPGPYTYTWALHLGPTPGPYTWALHPAHCTLHNTHSTLDGRVDSDDDSGDDDVEEDDQEDVPDRDQVCALHLWALHLGPTPGLYTCLWALHLGPAPLHTGR